MSPISEADEVTVRQGAWVLHAEQKGNGPNTELVVQLSEAGANTPALTFTRGPNDDDTGLAEMLDLAAVLDIATSWALRRG